MRRQPEALSSRTAPPVPSHRKATPNRPANGPPGPWPGVNQAYGDRIAGAVVDPRGDHRWMVAYDVNDRRNVVEKTDVGNIDHVLPQSSGGRTRLCNLQLMRAESNSRKSSDLRPDVSGEPMVDCSRRS